MASLLIVALWLFVVTNLDTLIVLVAFCVDEDYRPLEVFAGHYIGFCLGLGGALLGAYLAAEWLQQWTFLLGTVPLGLGIWGLVRTHPDTAVTGSSASEDPTAPEMDELQVLPGPTGRIVVVTAAAIGLNGENLAMYIPFFAELSMTQLRSIALAYLLAAVLLFVIAHIIARRTTTLGMPEWIDRRLVPAVLVVIGVYILVAGMVVT